MLTEVEDAYNLEVTSRFPGTSLPLFTSCAAVMWTYILLLLLLGTLAASATGGRRVWLIISGTQLAWAVTTSTLMLLA